MEFSFITIGNVEDCLSRRDTAKYLNVSLPTFDIMAAQSKSGQLKPPLPAIRLTPNGRAFYSKKGLDQWLELRMLSRK